MSKILYFDHASTTQCDPSAAQLVSHYSTEDYGNPESTHRFGQRAAEVIREARDFFSDAFNIEPQQVIFTGSGTEANNLAIQGTLLPFLHSKQKNGPPRAFFPIGEHSSVTQTFESLKGLGAQIRNIPIDLLGQIQMDSYRELLSASMAQPTFISIQQVNSVVGTRFPIEQLAAEAKRILPRALFHTDAVQSFGKLKVPQAPSTVDLVSISGHKIEGPKGIGALLVLNKNLLSNKPSTEEWRLRPLIWGGGQENGFRSGTPHAGLIAGFHWAAKATLSRQNESAIYLQKLQNHFKEILLFKGLVSSEPNRGALRWNSPPEAIPSIISLSAPRFPAAALARLLEEKNCLVSVGSACSAKKKEPEPVLKAMGLSPAIQNSAIRISLSRLNTSDEIDRLCHALAEAIHRMSQLG